MFYEFMLVQLTPSTKYIFLLSRKSQLHFPFHLLRALILEMTSSPEPFPYRKRKPDYVDFPNVPYRNSHTHERESINENIRFPLRTDSCTESKARSESTSVPCACVMLSKLSFPTTREKYTVSYVLIN